MQLNVNILDHKAALFLEMLKSLDFVVSVDLPVPGGNRSGRRTFCLGNHLGHDFWRRRKVRQTARQRRNVTKRSVALYAANR